MNANHADVTPLTAAPEVWGFIGLGEMGAHMAANLAKAQHQVLVYDKAPEAAASSVRHGAKEVATVEEVAQGASIISIAVRDERQVRSVIGDSDSGLVSAARSRTLVLLHSTIGSSACKRIAADIERAGCEFLDAPISGMRVGARKGTLNFLIGGDVGGIKRATSGLEAMGEKVFHMGRIGQGQTAKIANNLVSLATMMLLSEGLTLGAADGIQEDDLMNLFCSSTADSWIGRHWDFVRHEWSKTHPLGGEGVGEMIAKDLNLALAEAELRHLALPAAKLAYQIVPKLVQGLPVNWTP